MYYTTNTNDMPQLTLKLIVPNMCVAEMKEHDGSLYDARSALAVTHLRLRISGTNPVRPLFLLHGNTYQPLDHVACQHHVLLDTSTLDKQQPTQQGYHT
jgi:hypothetical protein